MHNSKEKNRNCRVCGLDQGEGFEPWGADGKLPSFDICSCCGVQFGYTDCDKNSVIKFRLNWISKGANWSHPKNKPDNWSKEEQMKQIPDEFK